jgi:hypothetical protein
MTERNKIKATVFTGGVLELKTHRGSLNIS